MNNESRIALIKSGDLDAIEAFANDWREPLSDLVRAVLVTLVIDMRVCRNRLVSAEHDVAAAKVREKNLGAHLDRAVADLEVAQAAARDLVAERDRALRVRDLARQAANRDLMAKRAAETELGMKRWQYDTLLSHHETIERQCERRIAEIKRGKAQAIANLRAKLKAPRESWRCFHCGFETADSKEAAGHFGSSMYEAPDAPICVSWAELSTDERTARLAELEIQMTEMQTELDRLREANDNLEYQVNGVEAAVASRFKGCRSIDEAWYKYDSMEGRALAAEERAIRAGWDNDTLRAQLFEALEKGAPDAE